MVLAGPSFAQASGGGGDPGTTAAVVGALALVALAYLGANLIVDRLQQWLLIVTGFEYLLLGVALGPQVPSVHVLDGEPGYLVQSR